MKKAFTTSCASAKSQSSRKFGCLCATRGEQVGEDLRLDLIVQGKVVVELKAVKALEPIHEAQLLTYMRLTGCKVGLLINFNVAALKHGIKRMVL